MSGDHDRRTQGGDIGARQGGHELKNSPFGVGEFPLWWQSFLSTWGPCHFFRWGVSFSAWGGGALLGLPP